MFRFYDGQCARCEELLSLVFDMVCRHTSARSAMFRARKSYPKMQNAFKSYRELLSSVPSGQDIRDPRNSKQLSPVLKKLRNVLTLYAPPLRWGPLERRRNISKLYAYGQFFGTAATFWTISPCMMDNVHCVEICLSDPMRLNSVIAKKIPLDYIAWEANRININFDSIEKYIRLLGVAERKKIVDENPVAQALAFHQLISTVFETLFQIQLVGHETRRGSKT